MRRIFKLQMITVLIYIFFLTGLNAQNTFTRLDIEFIRNTDTLTMAQVGGLNSPQFSEVDLNNDGVDDLYIFDRSGRKSLTFLYDGSQYVHAPEYEVNFISRFTDFVLLRDYNCDGIKDIFSYPIDAPLSSFEVYQGYYDVDNRIAFNKLLFPARDFDVLYYRDLPNYLNIYVPRTDVPVIDDIDNDGDLDILSFGILGGRVSYYQNQSQELGYGCDSLIFDLVDDCYGRFFESGISTSIDLSPSTDSCWGTSNWLGARHAGSSLLTWDLNDDGKKELILGDISFNNFVMLINGGTPSEAWMTGQDTTFPSYDVATNIPIFPAAFRIDINHDGADDLIASPNEANLAEGRNVVWYYQNDGNPVIPDFSFQQEDLFVGEMMDLGRGAAPTYFDYDADGLLDLVIPNYGYYDPVSGFTAQIALYRNVGTGPNPVFDLVDENWLNIANFGLRDLHAAFGDIDGDGDEDLMIGEETGKLYYLENTAGTGNAATFAPIVPNYQNIDVGNMSAPAIADMDRDGLNDLVIGRRAGIIEYFRNTGTIGNPIFTQQVNNTPNGSFGGIDVRPFGSANGYSVPSVVDKDGNYELYVGSEPGQIYMYNNIDGNLSGLFTEVTNDLDGIYEGYRSKIDVRDVNQDNKLDYTVGNFRGGLVVFTGDISIPTEGITQNAEQLKVALSPNPAKNYLQYEIEDTVKKGIVKIYNGLGQLVKEDLITTQNGKINLTTISSGLYFVQVIANGQRVIEKVLVAK